MKGIGFTGTQEGMTEAQKSVVLQLLIDSEEGEFHHGDCVGADAQAHYLARTEEYTIVIHPPTDGRKRAFCSGDRVVPARPFLIRNHEIVDATKSLIATPAQKFEKLRSGTWATIRYARKLGRPIAIIYPDGEIVKEQWPND